MPSGIFCVRNHTSSGIARASWIVGPSGITHTHTHSRSHTSPWVMRHQESHTYTHPWAIKQIRRNFTPLRNHTLPPDNRRSFRDYTPLRNHTPSGMFSLSGTTPLRNPTPSGFARPRESLSCQAARISLESHLMRNHTPQRSHTIARQSQTPREKTRPYVGVFGLGSLRFFNWMHTIQV